MQFIKNYFKQKGQNEDYNDIKMMLLKLYPNNRPVSFKWRTETSESYCIEDKKTRLCCEQFYNNALNTYALSLRYTYKKYLK